MKKRVITALVLLVAAGLTSCAKLYEEQQAETLRRPQTDIEIPQDTPWDDVPQEDNQTGH